MYSMSILAVGEKLERYLKDLKLKPQSSFARLWYISYYKDRNYHFVPKLPEHPQTWVVGEFESNLEGHLILSLALP